VNVLLKSGQTTAPGRSAVNTQRGFPFMSCGEQNRQRLFAVSGEVQGVDDPIELHAPRVHSSSPDLRWTRWWRRRCGRNHESRIGRKAWNCRLPCLRTTCKRYRCSRLRRRRPGLPSRSGACCHDRVQLAVPIIRFSLGSQRVFVRLGNIGLV
jgi:hypothetical protein